METPVIDFHCHVGRWGRYGMDDDPADYLRLMDAAGVDRACINCINFGDARRGNDRVARFVAQRPDRFVGVAYVTPRYPDEALAELDRCFDVLGFRSLKLYPDYLGKPIDDPAYDAVFEWADDRSVVIMSHSSYVHDDDWLTRPDRFVGLAQRYGKISWVLAHSGNARQGQEQAVTAARACPNVYLETCTSMGEHDTIEFLVDGAGEDRVLYGSDMPLMDPRLQVGRVVTADISHDAKLKILGLNAIELLGLDQPTSTG